jgi:hypothetical protein
MLIKSLVRLFAACAWLFLSAVGFAAAPLDSVTVAYSYFSGAYAPI